MKKVFLSVLALAFVFSVTSCRETEKKTEEAEELILEEAQEVEEAIEEAVEEVEEAVEEAAESLEEAANSLRSAQ